MDFNVECHYQQSLTPVVVCEVMLIYYMLLLICHGIFNWYTLCFL
jgi:hypothetical protein